MTRVVLIGGVDPSSKKIAVTITKEGDLNVDMRSIRLSATAPRKFVQAYDFIEMLCKDYKDADLRLFLEAPVLARGGPGSTIPQAMISGAIQTAAAHSKVPLIMCHNKSWKKDVLGNGNIKKEMIPGALLEIWPAAYMQAHGDGDLIDSACINRYGEQLYKLSVRMGKGTPRKTLIRRK